jgi:hypothetical protein
VTRLICLLTITASVILGAAVATAAGGTRPDDRGAHGPGALAPDRSTEAVRPDDGEWRGTEPTPTVVVVPSPSVRVDGFDWTDAGIGAAAALGLGLLLAGASALVRRRQRVAEFP